MVVGTKDNESMKIYIDGKLENELETQYVPDIDQQPLFLGYDGGYDYKKFHGTIDHIRIYNRALTVAEVKALYEFEKPKTQQASTATWTSDPSNPQNVIVEKAIRKSLKKPTGKLTKVDLEKVQKPYSPRISGATPEPPSSSGVAPSRMVRASSGMK